MQTSRLFDEFFQVEGGVTGRETVGGNLKKLWLGGDVDEEFLSQPLQRFFSSYRQFHQTRRDMTLKAAQLKTEDSKAALEEYKASILSDLRQLLSYFDDILQDPKMDWTTTAVDPSGQNGPKTENETKRDIRNACEDFLKRVHEEKRNRRPLASAAQAKATKARSGKRSSTRYHGAGGSKRPSQGPSARRVVHRSKSTETAETNAKAVPGRVLRSRSRK